MQLGVEYRTVERYNGKPVYVKAVNCGMLVGDKSVEHGVANMKACIEVNGCAGPQTWSGTQVLDQLLLTRLSLKLWCTAIFHMKIPS